MPKSVLGEDIEVAKGVSLPYGKVRARSCARLDLAERMIYAFELPALKMLIEGVRVHDWEVYYQNYDIKRISEDYQVRLFGEYVKSNLKELSGV